MPPLKAFGVPGAALLGVVLNQFQNQFGTIFGSWVTVFPWGWVSALIFVFWLGQLSAGWAGGRSWLRQWWNHRIALFDVVHIVPAHTIENDTELFNCRAKMRFRGGSQSTQCVMIVYFAFGNRNPNDGRIFSQVLWQNRVVAPSEEIDVDLATIPRNEAQQPHWAGPKTMMNGAPYLVEVRITSGWRTQAFRVRIDLMTQGSGTSGRFWMSEEKDLFALPSE